MTKERTFIAIKPDGVQRGYVAEIIGRFEKKGFKLVGLKQLIPSKDLAQIIMAYIEKDLFLVI